MKGAIVELKTYTRMELQTYLNSRITGSREIEREHRLMIEHLAEQALPFCEIATQEDTGDGVVWICAKMRIVRIGATDNIILAQMAKLEEAKDLKFKMARRRF